MNGTSLREAILSSDPTLLVSDVVFEQTAKALGDLWSHVKSMRIEWVPERLWGREFRFGDPYLQLGRRSGHHLFTHPTLFGVSDVQAEKLLRAEVEGTILHEIGHAVERAMTRAGYWTAGQLHEAAEQSDPPSHYDDSDAEVFAEAFRYWTIVPSFAEEKWPVLAALCQEGLYEVSRMLQ